MFALCSVGSCSVYFNGQQYACYRDSCGLSFETSSYGETCKCNCEDGSSEECERLDDWREDDAYDSRDVQDDWTKDYDDYERDDLRKDWMDNQDSTQENGPDWTEENGPDWTEEDDPDSTEENDQDSTEENDEGWEMTPPNWIQANGGDSTEGNDE